MTHTYIHKSDMYDPRSNTTTLLKMKNRMERTEEKPSATARAEILLTRMKTLYHTHALSPNQCSSTLVQTIDAPLPVVWSVLRRFGDPQGYKLLVKTCSLVAGDGVAAGSVRELTVVSGMPAERSTERLDRLDDKRHVMAYSIIGGDHKLVNYSETTTVHEDGGCAGRTVVMESYVVDIPVDSCEEDTCLFADTIIGYNLKSLAKITEKK